MKQLSIIRFLFIIFTFTSFIQCSTGQKLQEKAPFNTDEVYFQSWVAGVKGGGSGINLFILISYIKTDIVLDSVYFREKAVKLEVENNLFVGRFKTKANQQEDIILSSDPKDEYPNQLSVKENGFPFKLKENECVVSYIENKSTKYFKIENIKEKQAQDFPSAPKHP